MKQNVNPTVEDDGEEGTASLARISVSIPQILVTEIGGNRKTGLKGETFSIDFAQLPPDHLAGVVEYFLLGGYNLRLSNKFSVLEGTRAEKLKVTTDRNKEFQSGVFRRKGTAGGTYLSPIEEGWLAYLKARGNQQSGKLVSQKTLRQAMEEMCRRDILDKSGPAGSLGRKDAEANIGKHLKERFAAWAEWKPTALPDLAASIKAKVEEAERNARAAAQKAEEPVVDLTTANF